MNKKIVLFARDPGGADVISAIYRPLLTAGYNLVVIAKEFAIKIFQRNGINPIVFEDSESLRKMILEDNPELIVTGTSSDDFTEREIWRLAHQYGIKCAAILDQWVNYGMRFSSLTPRKLSLRDNKIFNIDYVPDKILVMDELAKKEGISEGLPPDRIVITGALNLEAFVLDRLLYPTNQYKSGQIDKQSFVFVSEPILETYGGKCYVGYDQSTILPTVISAIEELSEKLCLKCNLYIKRHPKEFTPSLHKFESKKISVMEAYLPEEDIYLKGNIFIGMSSMMLIRAAVLGFPVVSYQEGLLLETDPFPLSRMGIIKTNFSKEDLLKDLLLLAGGYRSSYSEILSSSYRGSIQRTVDYLISFVKEN